MKAKMQIYAEILRQLARMPDHYEEPDMGEIGIEEDYAEEDMDEEGEDSEYESAEERAAKKNIRVVKDAE